MWRIFLVARKTFAVQEIESTNIFEFVQNLTRILDFMPFYGMYKKDIN